MSAAIKLAQPIGTAHSTTTISVVDASVNQWSFSLSSPPTHHSSDEGQTAESTSAGFSSVRDPSEGDKDSNDVKKPNPGRSKSWISNQGLSRDKDEGEKGWTYDQQLKVY